jgi:3-oxoadipate enol-lactonase
MALHHELTGAGRPVVLLHAGITDSRLWDPQWRSFAGRYRLLRLDLPGFGRSPMERLPPSPAAEVADLLDELAISSAAIVGSSLGGRIALELAVARPELAAALVLVDAGLRGMDWSPELVAYGEAEDEAVRRGDLDAATELNLRTWVDGPRRRPEQVDASVRAAVGRMQREALALQAPHWDVDEVPLVPSLRERLAEVAVPTLVVVGEEDVEDIRQAARLLATTIPGARAATIEAAAHLPSLEQPEAFDAVVLPFLDEALAAPRP